MYRLIYILLYGTQGLPYNVRSVLNIICKSTICNDLTHWHIVNYLRRLASSDITYFIRDYGFLNCIINAEWIITQPPRIMVTRKNTIFARRSNFRHFMDAKNSLTFQKRSFLVPIFNQKKPVHIILPFVTEKYNKITKLMPLCTCIHHSLPG